MFECVINVAEGRDLDRLARFAQAAGASLRDTHHDEFHHRSVFTLINTADALERDVRALARVVFETLDLRDHAGVHPRFGVLDVVPFVALDERDEARAVSLRDETATWLSDHFNVPCFLYGPVGGEYRTLPEVRRHAFVDWAPDVGPPDANPRLGAVAVGARPVLLAWNLWLTDVSLTRARAIATALRRPAVRSLAFPVGDQVQVSCNLVDVGPGAHAALPSAVYDQVRELLGHEGTIDRAELVGLAPRAVLDAEDPSRWAQLGLDPEATIERRLGR